MSSTLTLTITSSKGTPDKPDGTPEDALDDTPEDALDDTPEDALDDIAQVP